MDVSAFTKNGKFLMLALDHRGSFRKLINPKNPEETDVLEAIEAKKGIIEAVFDQMSGLLIDLEYGMKAYATANIDTPKPFLIPMEESGYSDENGGRITNLETSAFYIKDQGALGTKLLVYFDPTKSKTAKKQIKTAKIALEDSHNNEIPLFLEIVTYGDKYKGKVTESVAMVLQGGVKPDVFKLEYPGTDRNCKIITEAIKPIPWILLTRGDDFESFKSKLKSACDNGCSGFLAGRALWQDMFSIKGKRDRKKFLQDVLPKRFKEISDIVL